MSSSAQITNPGQRRLAYQCLKCLHREDVKTIDGKYRILNHFYVKHVPLDRVPFYCRLCQIRCRTREELDKHVTRYARHRTLVKEGGPNYTADPLVVCADPYIVTPMDVAPLSAEDSREFWAQKAKKPDVLNQAIEAVFGSELEDVPVSPASQPIMPGVDVSQLMQPLQQLVNFLKVPGTTTAPTSSDTAHTSSDSPSSMRDTRLIKATVQTATQQGQPRALSPTPTMPESPDVLHCMPTREECRAMRSSASSSGSSSGSDCGHHNQILSEIRELKSKVVSLEERFDKQYHGIKDLATKLLEMAGQLATQKTPPATRETPAVAEERPLTARNGNREDRRSKENRPARPEPYRRDRHRDRFYHRH